MKVIFCLLSCSFTQPFNHNILKDIPEIKICFKSCLGNCRKCCGLAVLEAVCVCVCVSVTVCACTYVCLWVCMHACGCACVFVYASVCVECGRERRRFAYFHICSSESGRGFGCRAAGRQSGGWGLCPVAGPPPSSCYSRSKPALPAGQRHRQTRGSGGGGGLPGRPWVYLIQL